MQEMKAFWLPSKTPEARAALDKPSLDTICPATGKKLKLKDLITVNFTRVPEGEEGFAMDPVTKDTLSNANKLAVIKPTGDPLIFFIIVKLLNIASNLQAIKHRHYGALLNGSG